MGCRTRFLNMVCRMGPFDSRHEKEKKKGGVEYKGIMPALLPNDHYLK